MRLPSLLLLTALAFSACPRPDSPGAEERLEALAAPHALDTLMQELVQLRNNIQIQGRALMPDEIAFSEKVDALELQWRQWRNRVRTLQEKVAARQVQADALPLDSLEQKRTTLQVQAEQLLQAW